VTTSAYLRAANQPPPLEGYDLFSQDAALVEALRREGGAAREDACAAFGRLCGGEPLELGRLANENVPKLRAFDRFGARIDEVEFHPAWHELMRIGVEHGVHAFPWADPEPAPHVSRAARFMTLAYAEAGVGCPLSMTYSVVPALRADPGLTAVWEPGLTARVYEPGLRPRAEKTGLLSGMALTERQGGSDVRANEMRAEPLPDGGYGLTGEKWFCSAPMCDVFLVLAYAPDGLTCFVLPRVLPDGTRNGFHVQRLKDKLGNRSNASAEIELRDAWAARLGEEGRGVATIIEMVAHTRLDCVLGSTALMRRAVAEATHHAAHRAAFGHLLVDVQPFARAVVVLDHTGSATYADNVELVVGDSAELTVVVVNDWADDTVHLSQQSLRLGRDAKLRSIAVGFGGDVARVSSEARFTAPGSEVEMLGLYFADAHQHLEHRLFVDHAVPHCKSNVVYKGALQGDEAHTVWIGDVLIRAEAEGTETFELNRNLVLTDGARADSVPNLEIETGEIVGAGHASATGRFDDEQLFYLQSRGIPEDEARRLVVRGFFADVINKIGIPEVRDRLLAQVEQELEGAVH